METHEPDDFLVNRDTARVNIDILGIREIKQTGMGEFYTDDHYIYHCGQEFLRRNGVPSQSTKESEKQYLGAVSKNDRMISVYF